jgi:hypothetical protein
LRESAQNGGRALSPRAARAHVRRAGSARARGGRSRPPSRPNRAADRLARARLPAARRAWRASWRRNVYDNYLSDSVPSQVGELTALTYLCVAAIARVSFLAACPSAAAPPCAHAIVEGGRPQLPGCARAPLCDSRALAPRLAPRCARCSRIRPLQQTWCQLLQRHAADRALRAHGPVVPVRRHAARSTLLQSRAPSSRVPAAPAPPRAHASVEGGRPQLLGCARAPL